MLNVFIGLPKTGTTFIQQRLHALAAPMRNQGVHVFRGRPNYNDLYLLFSPEPEKEHDNVRKGLTSRDAAEARNRTIVREFRSELDSWRAGPFRTGVLSGEALGLLSPEGAVELHSMLAEYADAINIIVFTRNPIDFATSFAQELIKGGSTIAREEKWPSLPCYARRIGGFAEAFGRDNITVVDYDHASKQHGGILRRALQVMGLPPAVDEDEPAGTRPNASLSMNAVRILSRINEIYPVIGVPEPKLVGRKTIIDLLSKIGGDKFSMPPHWRKMVKNLSLDDCIWLRDVFGIDYTSFDISRLHSKTVDIPEIFLDDLANIIYEASCKVEVFISDSLRFRSEAAAHRGDVDSVAMLQRSLQMILS
ncbi:hypothetical protein DD559_05485 [Sphingomonas pokkalii]|uniref:Uncharacterized protein n=2 Tax=Sphingomonas pokkalii TaxID=2175090 RepID=A0A2U0SBU5_9SPHN|nr:hypothetical protein DD559_05485 [Sphingomonas pokkalii]